LRLMDSMDPVDANGQSGPARFCSTWSTLVHLNPTL